MAGATGKALVTLYLIEKEGNYGWNVREGSYCFNTDTNTEGRAPALVDPAAYYGHGETDLAMMTLFGAFDRAVFDAYHDVHPQQSDHDDRESVYQLYHLINHLNHFGEGYAGGVQRILRRLG